MRFIFGVMAAFAVLTANAASAQPPDDGQAPQTEADAGLDEASGRLRECTDMIRTDCADSAWFRDLQQRCRNLAGELRGYQSQSGGLTYNQQLDQQSANREYRSLSCRGVSGGGLDGSEAALDEAEPQAAPDDNGG